MEVAELVAGVQQTCGCQTGAPRPGCLRLHWRVGAHGLEDVAGPSPRPFCANGGARQPRLFQALAVTLQRENARAVLRRVPADPENAWEGLARP